MDENCGNVVMPKAKLSFFGSLCTLQNVICCRSIQGSCGDFLGTMWPGGLPISMWGHSEIDHFLLQKSLQILVTSILFVRYKQFQKVVSRKKWNYAFPWCKTRKHYNTSKADLQNTQFGSINNLLSFTVFILFSFFALLKNFIFYVFIFWGEIRFLNDFLIFCRRYAKEVQMSKLQKC